MRLLRLPFVLATIALAACQSDAVVAPSGTLPDRVTISLASVSLPSLGDTATVRARVVDAAGNDLAGVPLIWSVSEPEILEPLGAGLFRSRANGTVRVRVQVDPSATGARPSGYYVDQLVDSITVTVEQQPAHIVAVAADSAYSLLDLTRSFAVRVTDARDNLLAVTPALHWRSENPAVATVDSTGRVRSTGNGQAAISVRAGEATWGTMVRVNASRAHVSCMRYFKRRQQQQQCVTSTVTLRAPREGQP